MLSHVGLLATPWTVAHQAPLSMGILQAGILEWVAMLFSRGSSSPRDQTCVFRFAGGLFTTEPPDMYLIRASRVAHGGSEGKASACNGGDPDSIPWFRRSPGEGNGTPLQYSCLEKLTDRGAWLVTVHWVAKSWTVLKQLITSRHAQKGL